MNADPTQNVPGNIARRILKIIRDEYAIAKGNHTEGEMEESLQKMLTIEYDKTPAYDIRFDNLKESIHDNVNELLSELDTSAENIAAQSLEHIYSDEVIMTVGKSKTVEAFLKYAAKKKRRFQVVVTECAPFYTVNILFI